MKIYTNEDFLKDIKEGKQVIPLMTIKAMHERWGLDRHKVYNLSRRDKNFPNPIQGVLKGLSKGEKIYPYHEVKRYEQEKGLIQNNRNEVIT